MTTNAIKQLGAEFHHAADGVGEALLRLEHARADRLAFLRQPYRAGLPPERLRKVWAEWEEKDSGLVDFRGDEYLGTMGDGTRDRRWRPMAELGGFADRNLWAFRPHGVTWAEVEAMADEAEKPAEPKMLDLRTLPPGTVCEATGEILTYLGRRIKPGEVFRIIEPDDGMGDKHPTNIEIEFAGFSVPALVPARVVKEGGEQ